jgi:hypothetical protein
LKYLEIFPYPALPGFDYVMVRRIKEFRSL